MTGPAFRIEAAVVEKAFHSAARSRGVLAVAASATCERFVRTLSPATKPVAQSRHQSETAKA